MDRAAQSDPTASEQALAALRRDVLSASAEPGGRLKMEVLQARYGFSSSPLREALNRLVQEGLVVADERRGFRAAELSLDDLRDINHMRLLLDPQALLQATVHGDDRWESQIVAVFYRLEKVESRLGDGPVVLDDEWGALHREFHQALIAGCPSTRQKALCASLFDQAERYRRYTARNRRTARRKTSEHRRLMEATLARDGATASALLLEHIRSTQRSLEAILESRTNNAAPERRSVR
jgi:DNA-binding GntR family transcriptional regulator